MCTKIPVYDVLFLKYGSEKDIIFCQYLGHFLSFYQPPSPFSNNTKNQNLEKKKKKIPGDIILSYINVLHK